MSSTRQQEQQRLRIAMAAARHMSESGVTDFQLAKRKACQQLAVPMTRNLPSNQEIRDALREYQGLFKSDQQSQLLSRLRATAIEALKYFQQFKPRLSGDVLAGLANEHTAVELHLFAEYPEQVSLFLLQERIPYQERQKRISYGNDSYEFIPCLRFLADEVQVELLVFPANGLRRAPNSVIDGKPVDRADLKAVETLASLS